MQRHVALALGTLAAVTAALVAAGPAGAKASGGQTFDGIIVTSGTSGARVVVSSTVRAKGVFNGVGRIVETDSLPGDPADSVRDDLVFAGGAIHLVTTNLGFSFSLDPKSCLFTAAVDQEGFVDGGTGQFVGATGTYRSTVSGRGLLARNPDGSCALDRDSLHEVDTLAASGSFSF
jgi:hypothetical protein